MATTETRTNPVKELQRYGQSVWMDNFRRGWITSGELRKMTDEFGLKGCTTNPSIFEKAVMGGADYDDTMRDYVRQGMDTAAIYDELMIGDVRMAADVFRPVYDNTDGVDGFVSIELPPALARDPDESVRKAQFYRKKVGRENIFVKVPGTAEGVKAIEQLIYEGINVNITLLFSISNYEAVAYAYIRGLERRRAEGKRIDRIASVASFFVSRIDTVVDKKLDETVSKEQDETRKAELKSLRGKAAIANAKLAYQRFKEIFTEPRFKDLASHGAREQRVLWASTSTKDPAYPDVYYVEALIGPRTVDTMPTPTVFAFANHGKVYPALEEGVEESRRVFDRIDESGIDFDAVTEHLEVDGIDKFQKSVDDVMSCLEGKRKAMERILDGHQTARLGDYQSRVDYALASLTEQAFVHRLWEKDPSIWKQGHDADKGIRDRLGWLDVAQKMLSTPEGGTQTRADEITAFVEEARAAGFTQAVLMGMGGSSLSPEVSRLAFGVKEGYLDLIVIDTTVPSAILDAERRIDPAKTLFIVSTKSGGTVETLSAYRFFYEKVKAAGVDDPGKSFIAITDPGTSLQSEAEAKGFRKVFTNFEDIGGRYSALSYFGLVPAAVIGVDVKLLLDRAQRMVACSAGCVGPADSPGIVLGTIVGELAEEGHDKLTLVMSPEIAGFGYWVEQLVAESTGKNGVGIVPVEGEQLGAPVNYADDRLFVYVKLSGSADTEIDAKIKALEKSGQPVVRIELADLYDLGQEYFRWEMATATACAILGVNAFDQPNVQESKSNTDRLLGELKEKGELPSEQRVIEENGVTLYCDADTKALLDKIIAAGPYPEPSLQAYLAAHLNRFQPGNYFALMAFLPATPRIDGVLQCMRGHLRDSYTAATTSGYGPRFLHSTGQLHKGGPNIGIFIQFTADDAEDVEVPGAHYTFSTLKQAQSMGDAQALENKGRPMIRIHLGADPLAGLNHVLDLVHQAVTEQSEP